MNTQNYLLSSTKKVNVQSYLVLEKNRKRNISGNQSYTDIGSEEEYSSEMRQILALSTRYLKSTEHFLNTFFHLQTTQISRITDLKCIYYEFYDPHFTSGNPRYRKKEGFPPIFLKEVEKCRKKKTRILILKYSSVYFSPFYSDA